MKLSKTWARAVYIFGLAANGLYAAVILAALLLGQENSLFMWSFQMKIPLAVLFLMLFLVWWYGESQYRAYFPNGELPKWMRMLRSGLELVCLFLAGEFLRRAGLELW